MVGSLDAVEVFADVTCPFAHVGLRRFVTERDARGTGTPRLRVRSWPLELVNGAAMDGHVLSPKIEALRASVAAGRFAGFDPDRFPTTSIPALAGESAAHRAGGAQGEAFSLAIRDALFERGLDIGDRDVVAGLLRDAGLPPVTDADVAAVAADHRAGVARGVIGSPHFFAGDRDFFCPSLAIDHDDTGIHVAFDAEGFDRFLAATLA